MNKANFKTKQQNKLAVLMAGALLAVLVIVSLAIGVNQQKADAEPSSSLQAQIDALQPTLNETSERYHQAMINQEQCQKEVDEAQGRITYCNEKIPSLQNDIGRTMRKQYRDGGLGFLEVFFNSKSFDDFMVGLNDLEIVNRKATDNLVECRFLREQLRSDMETLVVKLNEAKEASASASAAKADAESSLKQLQDAMAAASEEERQAASRPSGGGPTPGPVPAGEWSGIANIALSLCDGTHMYEWGGIGPQNFDCSGLVSYCINGGVPGRRGTAETFCGWPTCEAAPGCIVANGGHCGIYIGNGQMVHAPTFGQPVQVGSVQGGMGFHTPHP